MLGGGGDSLGDHLLCSWFWSLTQHFAPEVLQPAERLGRHGEPTPALGRPVKYRPDQAEAALLTGQSADHLHSAAGLAEGALD